MDLLPAFTITPETPLSQALELSYEHEYSYLPVVSTKSKRLLGYLTADLLREAHTKSTDFAKELVRDHYIRFFGKNATGNSSATNQDGNRTFLKMTPSTPLEDLEQFFQSGQEFAIITDEDRRFVLGVAVKEDLEKFVKGRPLLK